MTEKRGSNGWAGGWILVGLGAFLLLGQWFPQNGSLFLALLAAGFIAVSLFARKIGFLIPGGILAGVALGAYLIDPARSSAPDTAEGGLFLLAFAAGWALISLLSPLVGRWQWWPLVPAGVLALVGWAVWADRLEVLERLNWVWPLILLAAGLWLLMRPPRAGRPQGQA